MSQYNQIFARCVEKLLEGYCICEHAFPLEFEFLSTAVNQEEVNRYLLRLHRCLSQTSDQQAFFASYETDCLPGYQTQIRAQFNEAINELEPLVRWINLCHSAQNKERPLQTGMLLKESDLLKAIENAPMLTDELSKLSDSKLFSNQQTVPKNQLRAILKKLCEHGFLKEQAPSGSIYVATGRWSRLYDLMAFIHSHEVSPEKEEEQSEFSYE